MVALLSRQQEPMRRLFRATLAWIFLAAGDFTSRAEEQNPSPQVEHTRRHERLVPSEPAGRRVTLAGAKLFVPEGLPTGERTPLCIHFQGPAWLCEQAASGERKTAMVTVNAASKETTLATEFSHPEAFTRLLREAEAALDGVAEPLTLSAFSGGYAAVRSVLAHEPHYQRVTGLLLVDGLHTGYVGGKPGPRQSQLEAERLQVFVRFARDAARSERQMLVTHSEIFPGTFASSTETADHLLEQLELPRTPVLEWGPRGMQQLSESRRSGLRVVGFAGNSGPDHLDQLHSLPEFVTWLGALGDGEATQTPPADVTK